MAQRNEPGFVDCTRRTNAICRLIRCSMPRPAALSRRATCCCLSERACARRTWPVFSSFVGEQDPSDGHDYLAREAKARVQIDKQLADAGWKVQSQEALNLGAGPGF